MKINFELRKKKNGGFQTTTGSVEGSLDRETD